ncbi:hypothetical protein OAV29_03605 [Candidatus Poseidoniaceae archaeon]|nr:hypothetical protein [Candidatus Poseidoniaceae archaeon]|tara:strand:- start:202 stop:1404 length:1203 start_codon:yes stop_codon:yes gene_type:complete
MAGEVDPQSDVSLLGGRPRTLHLKMLRKQWQIITLQVVATIALVWMYLEVVSTYVVNSIDHTMVFETLESLVGEVPIGDWITGEGRQGLARFYVPIILGLLLGGSMALMAFQSPKLQQRIKLGFIILLMVSLVGRLLLTWVPSMIFSLDFRAPSEGELKTLEWPLLMILSLVILFVYLLPVIMGTRGIWGLSRRSIGWAIGFTLLFLGIHAILTFPLIKSQLGDWGANLKTLETQVSDPTIGIFGFDLVTPEQLSLILIAVLIMVFQESGFGVIRYLEYAYRLPESCKRDPEYVKQMDNVLNGHLRHTAGFLTITGLMTMIALGFHSVLLEIVSSSTGSQWAAQVSESIELSLTYGLVISALLFLSLIAVMRFFIPWERVWGLIESLGNKTEAPVEEKKF